LKPELQSFDGPPVVVSKSSITRKRIQKTVDESRVTQENVVVVVEGDDEKAGRN